MKRIALSATFELVESLVARRNTCVISMNAQMSRFCIVLTHDGGLSQLRVRVTLVRGVLFWEDAISASSR